VKLVIAIVQDEDVHELLHALVSGGHRVTRVGSTGGFLRAGNSTIFIGTEDERLEEVLHAIEGNCRQRRVALHRPPPIGPVDAFSMVSPVEVEIGGAVVFVLDVDRFVRF
jgi:uncharacterized protein YaaQ